MLTASTLNNEVLPAFWSPIIVISISVALFIERSLSVTFFHGKPTKSAAGVSAAERRSHNLKPRLNAAAAATTSTHQNNLNSQSYILLNRPAMTVRSQSRAKVGRSTSLVSLWGNGCLDWDARGCVFARKRRMAARGRCRYYRR